MNVTFATGTDEHGSKVQQTAKNSQLPVKDFCHVVSNRYKNLSNTFNINYTNFIRTTDDNHKRAVTKFWVCKIPSNYILYVFIFLFIYLEHPERKRSHLFIELQRLVLRIGRDILNRITIKRNFFTER